VEILGDCPTEDKKEIQCNLLALFELPLLGSTAQRLQAAEPGGASESGGNGGLDAAAAGKALSRGGGLVASAAGGLLPLAG